MKAVWILLVAIFLRWAVVSIQNWLRTETGDDSGCAPCSAKCVLRQQPEGAYLFDCSDSEV
jgi:hypothetical protein